ncbi:MAG: hypothetical protein ACD_3C00188G0029 [uncultured bacterium (gcode 4)]|uniref:Uncharacterized protein n=1 Tax=uncultured bacterium (gcode 4) TaxID=1234023 RepID=K2FXE3_9BACT|nr:MAG: hypothetical protein ACD_3C00188G0029 [uncultured bacterium (gcode 4)]
MNSLSKENSQLTKNFILSSAEWIHFERKWIEVSLSKLANSIIGMLNAEWWVIVLWINNWNIQDLNSLSNTKLNDFRQIMANEILPPCNVKIEEITVDWVLIFIYHIEPEYERVFKRKGNENIYLRIWDETRELSRDEVQKLEYDRNLRSFEDQTRLDFVESDFRMTVLDFYKEKMSFVGDYRDLLVNRNLAIHKNWNYLYKNSAILLFSEDPEKYIPSASLRYIRYDWTYMKTWVSLNIIKDERFHGCIPLIIETIKRFMKNVLKDFYFLDIEQWKFIKVSEYPEDAWLEWIINALTHRSYNLQWNVIYIKHYSDRLEISNSWPLPSFVTIENILNTRFSRNPRIARVLYEMWYVRELNEWVKRIFESMEKYFLAKPEYKDEHNIVTLILKNNIAFDDRMISLDIRNKIEKSLSTLARSEQIIMINLLKKWKQTVKELSKDLGLKDRTIRENIKKLEEKGLIIRNARSPRDPNTFYTIW